MRFSARWKKFKAWLQKYQEVIAFVLTGSTFLVLLVSSVWLIRDILQERAIPQLVPPLLTNGSFEGGTSRDTIYWTLHGGPFHTQFSEVEGPEGWSTWWREGFLCSGTSDWRTGRPEVGVISGPDRARIHSGKQAVQWFTFWRCHSGGLLQQVAVEPGHYYQFSTYAHSWFSNCSHRPHDPPYDYDCMTPIDWVHDWLRVGIDPTGGIDPLGPEVVWGQAREIYGVYDRALTTGRIQAQSETITVFVKSEASHPLKHVDSYFDDAMLRDVTYQMFLPVAVKGAQ